MNPFQMLAGMKNPQKMVEMLMDNSQIMQNQIAKNAIDMYRSGNNEGLQKMAENICKEKGTTPDEIRNGIMKQFGM